MITHEGITCQLKFVKRIKKFLQTFLTNLQKKYHVI